jgi:hypothetical protein
MMMLISPAGMSESRGFSTVSSIQQIEMKNAYV